MTIGAIEAGGTKFVLGIGNEKGEIFEKISIPTEDPNTTMTKVIEFFKDKNIEALGVGCFGPIDLNKDSTSYGYITTTPKLKWANYNIVGELKKYFNIPIGFDTDVNGAALGELTWGAAKNLNSAVYITIGTGIGAGAIIEGRMIHGLLHPEMGHILVKRHDKDNYEGKCPYHKDCLEGLAAGPAIEARWGKKGHELESASEVWEMEAFYLAQAIANFVLILSPEKIILGGGVMNQKHLFPLIRAKVIKNLAGYVNKKEILENIDSYIVSPLLGDNAGLCGAIALGLKEINKL